MFDWNWYSVSKFDPRAVGLYSRHYSAVKNGKSKQDWLAHGITAPGESITLMTSDALALFVWLKQQYIANDQTGVNCAVFRNEGNKQSSELILEAEQLAWAKWPGERLYTYVSPNDVESSNPGYCFKCAGWQPVRNGRKPQLTKSGLLILEKLPIFLHV